MSLENKIITNSNIKQRNLLRAATIASEKPDTGVTILKKSAYFVIRDCADITQKYLVMLCYSSYTDPVNQLKGKFSRDEVIDFVRRSKEQDHTRQLLYVLLSDTHVSDVESPTPVTDFDEDDADNIYGDYDYVDADDPQPVKPPIVDVSVDDENTVVDAICSRFSVK